MGGCSFIPALICNWDGRSEGLHTTLKEEAWFLLVNRPLFYDGFIRDYFIASQYRRVRFLLLPGSLSCSEMVLP